MIKFFQKTYDKITGREVKDDVAAADSPWPEILPEQLVSRAMSQAVTASPQAVAALRHTLAKVSRREALTNGHYCGILNRVSCDRVVSGPKLRPQFENEEWNRALSRRWLEWMRATKFARNLRLAIRDAARDGATLGVFWSNDKVRHPVQFDVRFIDSLRLVAPLQVGRRKRHIDGIDLDDNDRPTKYYVSRPIDLTFGENMTLDPLEYDADKVVHYFDRKTSDQYHGIPEASAALMLWPQVRRYVASVIRAAEVSSNFVFTLESKSDFANETQGKSTPFNLLETVPGMIQELPDGYTLKSVTPTQPNQNHEELIKSIVNEAAGCFDMPLIMAIRSASDANFASANFDAHPYECSTGLHRGSIEADIVEPVAAEWFSEGLLVEDYFPADLRRAIQTFDDVPHGWGWDRIRKHNDPLKNAKATETQLATMEMSIMDVHEDRGSDARESLESEAKFYGVSVETMARLALCKRFSIDPEKYDQFFDESGNEREPANA